MAASGTVESEANVTDIHEALHFDVLDDDSDDGLQRGFGIWSLSWAANGVEVVAGTGDDSLYLYNMDRQKVGAPADVSESILWGTQIGSCIQMSMCKQRPSFPAPCCPHAAAEDIAMRQITDSVIRILKHSPRKYQ